MENAGAEEHPGLDSARNQPSTPSDESQKNVSGLHRPSQTELLCAFWFIPPVAFLEANEEFDLWPQNHPEHWANH